MFAINAALTLIIAWYVAVFGAILAGLYGWVSNIMLIVNGFDTMGTGEAVVRIFGIPVAILGAVMGYL